MFANILEKLPHYRFGRDNQQMKLGSRKYHGFLIDADNTIFDYDRCEEEAFRETIKLTNYQGSLNRAYFHYRSINRLLWKEFENNTIKAKDINLLRFQHLKKLIHFTKNTRELASIYLNTLSQKCYTFPGTVRVLEKLSCRASLCLITNGLSYVQRNRLAKAGLEVFFDEIIISEEIGYAKPDPRFFGKVMEKLRFPSHELLCVGDSPGADIKGAIQSGIDSCWIAKAREEYPVDLPLPDYIISDFDELLQFAPEPC